MTDFSNDEVLRIDEYYSSYSKSGHSSRRVITQHVENGNVVISDNSSVTSSGKDKVTKNVDPIFSITLQGVSDISQVADAQYRIYYSNELKEHGTFRDLFGIKDSAVVASATATDTVTTAANTTTTVTTVTTETVTTTTTTESTVTAVDTTTNSKPASTISGGDTIINNYYGDYNDFSGNNGTIINQSSVAGGVTNNTSIDNSATIIKYGDTYTYSGGNKIIENYQQGEVVKLASDYQGIDLNGNSFFVKSSSGQLEIQNSRDKFIGYSAESEVVAYSYVASGGGNVDGRDKNVAEIFIGADNADNQIYAGSGGSSLWGGIGGTDTLIGGEGYDEFFYAVGSGSDIMQNVGDNDLINLASINLSQISGVDVSVGQVNINFVDGGNLQINGGSSVGYQIAEGTFQVNQSTKEWSNK